MPQQPPRGPIGVCSTIYGALSEVSYPLNRRLSYRILQGVRTNATATPGFGFPR